MKYNSIYYLRYMTDMGPLRQRTVVNSGTRQEPHLDVRVAEYKAFLSAGGIIENSERIIVGVRGGGIALVTVLPESLGKKCQRNSVKFNRGDVTVVVHMLKPINDIESTAISRPAGSADYVRDISGKQTLRTILLSNIVLPTIRTDMTRNTIIACTLLDPSERRDGLDVHRLQISEIDMLSERESELFNSIEG
jgi:hypothetical protein